LRLSILKNIDDNDRKEIEEICKKYLRTMMCAAFNILKDHALAEDAVSESFVKIIKSLNKIKSLECHPKVRYIVIIVENTAKDIMRKRLKETSMMDVSEDSLEKIPDEDIDILSGLVVKESCDLLTDAIKSLPDKLKEVAYLYMVMGHSHDEISEMLGISYNTSKKRLSRAKEKVKKILAGDDNEK
jgi:RNA polymerase sigma-70 factor (ECF subfamily)